MEHNNEKSKNFINQKANLPYYIIIESEQAEINNFSSKTDCSAICCRNGTTGVVKAIPAALHDIMQAIRILK